MLEMGQLGFPVLSGITEGNCLRCSSKEGKITLSWLQNYILLVCLLIWMLYKLIWITIPLCVNLLSILNITVVKTNSIHSLKMVQILFFLQEELWPAFEYSCILFRIHLSTAINLKQSSSTSWSLLLLFYISYYNSTFRIQIVLTQALNMISSDKK